MKNFKFKWLLLSIILSIASINQVWAANIFMKPSGDWTSSEAWSAAYFYIDANNDGTAEYEKWVSMSAIGGTDLYTCEVPTDHSYAKVIFVRMASGKSLSDKWNGKWNQTGNLDIEGANKYCEISGYGNTEWKTLPTHSTGKVLYLKPCTSWKGGARFAAYFYGSEAKWENMTVVEGSSNNYYSVTVPSGTFPFVIFCRMNASNPTNSWENINDQGPFWNQTKDIAPDGSYNLVRQTNDTYDRPTTDWKDYAPVPTIIGSFNTWDKDTGTPFEDGSADVTLTATSDVEFKILDGETWYGNSNLFVGQSSSITFTDGGGNSHVITGDAGSYTFTYNASYEVTVSYPDNHPSSNYVYFKIPDGWSTIYAHRWSGSYYNTSWPGWILGTTTIGDADYAFMSTYGLTNFVFHKNAKDGDNDIKTGDLSLSTNAGKQYTGTNFTTDRAGSWSANFPITVTLGRGDHGSADGTASLNLNDESFSSSTAVTESAGYAVEGYYDGTTKVLNQDRTFAGTDIAGYISDGKWIKTSNCTLTAKYVYRYGLYGSLKEGGDPAGGMPGWTISQDIPYSTGTYTTTVDLTKPNSLYKFRILDRRDNRSYGRPTGSTYINADEATILGVGDGYDDAEMGSAGIGTYTFTVVEDEGKPKVTITNPESLEIDFGTPDGLGSASASVTIDEVVYPITAEKRYVHEGATVVFVATANPGYALEGWYTSYDAGVFSGKYTDGGDIVIDGDTLSISNIDEDINVYAKFEPVTLTFTTTGEWDEEENWSPAKVPTIEHDVILAKPVTVNVANAKAKSVVIDQYNGRTGKLTVNSNGALVVATTIKKLNASNEEVATEESDIVLESDGTYGTGALVAGSASTTTKATVHFYSKAKKDASSGYINQYFGIPMDSVSKLNYYGSYLQKFDQPNDAWKSFTSESKLGPWTAYRIMRNEESEGTYQIGGTLLLPGTGAGKTKTLTVNSSDHDGDNMFANSWAAPIYIPAMVTDDETPDFSGVTATIYIYNAGSLSDYTYGSTYADKTASPGQWVCLPVLTVASDKVNYLTVIPSQQAFLVQTTSGGTLTLDYKKHVYDPAVASGATIVPTYAPQRVQDNDMEKMRLYLTGESGASDRLMMYMREDFTSGFDDGWEGFKLPGSAFVPQICAYSDAGEMSINAINDAEGTVLGFYAGTEDSEYTFTFDYEGEQVWYLNDLEAQQSTLINAASSYNFSAVPGTVAERRFVISHTPIAHVPTGIDNSETVEGTQARKQMINGILYIIRSGKIYSTDGQIVK